MRYAEASYSGEGATRPSPAVSNSVLGMIIFIAAEMMFFGGLISAYMIASTAVPEWPPLDQPRLPALATAFNSLALIASGVALFLAGRVFNTEGYSKRSEKWLLGAIGLGAFFVLFQGVEWIRLISFGLTMTSSNYGSFFYLIIGVHAAHAVAAILALARVYQRMRKRTLKGETYRAGQAFWYFVVGIWPVLYILVYLN